MPVLPGAPTRRAYEARLTEAAISDVRQARLADCPASLACCADGRMCLDLCRHRGPFSFGLFRDGDLAPASGQQQCEHDEAEREEEDQPEDALDGPGTRLSGDLRLNRPQRRRHAPIARIDARTLAERL